VRSRNSFTSAADIGTSPLKNPETMFLETKTPGSLTRGNKTL
jgi:hypothetical protein